MFDMFESIPFALVLLSSLTLLCLVSIIYIYCMPIKRMPLNTKMALNYFALYFTLSFLAYISFTFYVYFHFNAQFFATTAIILFTSAGYCLLYGVKWRCEQTQHLSDNFLVIFHLVVLALVFTVIIPLKSPLAAIRTPLIYANLLAIYYIALRTLLTSKRRIHLGDRMMQFSLIVALIAWLVAPLTFFYFKSLQAYHGVVFVSQNLIMTLVLGAILNSTSYDQIDIHRRLSITDPPDGSLQSTFLSFSVKVVNSRFKSP